MVFCSNCHCDIDDSKFFLHQRFCIQNIKYCEQCEEGIIIEEYEEHCKNHNKKSEEKKRASKELRDSLTLSRVNSSKIGCEFCGYFCGFDELEEHEKTCGARSTTCKKCGKNLLIRDLNSHIQKEHNLDIDNYKEMRSGSLNLNKDQNSSNLYGNLGNLDLNRMTSDEQIAYALQLSQEEEQRKQQQIKNKKKESIPNKKDSLRNKKSSIIDYDEMDYEYEKQLYEEEMKNFGDEK